MAQQLGSWKVRRRFMFAVSGFCVLVVAGTLLSGRADAVAGTAITMSFTTLASIVASYVFGAVWDDHNARAAGLREGPRS